ncbi:hypothetical protein [Streptomyces sp. NPDC047453]|uniref:hypothetical protein n=1 Tax=Streptomyces sp. NPDC047453 TaxID=3154812 RepID=UPI0033C88C83
MVDKGGEGAGVGGLGGLVDKGGEGAAPGVGTGGGSGVGPGAGLGGAPGRGPGGVQSIVPSPGVIARGGQLVVTIDGCRNGGTMSSTVFSQSTLRPFDGAGERARGVVTIRDDARPGTYDITVDCNGRRLTRPEAFTVVGGVRGGVGGGTITGATPADMAIGGGLMAAGAVGGGVLWMRRRSDKRS